MDLTSMYDQLMLAINEIDVQLDSRTDGKSASKRSIVTDLIEQTSDKHADIVNKFIEQLGTLDDATRAGIYYGITRGLSKAFDESVSTYVNNIVENMPAPTPLCDDDEAAELSKVRSEAYSRVKKLIELADSFGEDHDYEMPRRRTGATGKRGKRAASFITWTIGDEEFENLKAIQDKYSAHYEKVKDLTAAIKAAGINLTDPPAEFTFDLPDGKILTGNYNPPAVGDEDEDEDENSDAAIYCD